MPKIPGMKSKIAMIVDQQDLSQLLYITSVSRDIGPVVKNRIISVNAWIMNDVLNSADVLNRIFTGELQKIIFSDQPDRYWEGRIKPEIKPNNSEKWANMTIDIEVPDGVAYAIEPKTISVSNQESVTLTNNGTEAFYPTFDFHTTTETYMVSAVTNDAVFQYGESLDAAPTKKVNVSRVETTDGHETTKTQLFYNGRWDGVETHPYEVQKIVDSWVTSGNWHKRGGTAPTVGSKAKIAKWANHWQTGEKMDSWVKGKSFPVVQVKNVNQSKSKKAYLLKNGQYYLGWVLEQDIDTGGGGSTGKNPNDLIPAYGANVGEKWRGPAMRYYIDGHCTNWDCHVWLNYFKERPNERGAFYFAIMRGDTVIASIQLSSHQNNMNTWINFNARQQGMDMGAYDKQLASHMWGRLHIKKDGDKFTFDVMKDNGKKLQRSYTVPSDEEDLEPSHVLVWAGVYGAFPHAQEISAVKLNFQGNNTRVWVSPKDETVTEIMNLPDPSTIIPAGETVRLEMSTGLAYRNGGESLTPIQYGSKPVKILPGEQEVILACDGEQQPDVDIYYREVFR